MFLRVTVAWDRALSFTGGCNIKKYVCSLWAQAEMTYLGFHQASQHAGAAAGCDLCLKDGP